MRPSKICSNGNRSGFHQTGAVELFQSSLMITMVGQYIAVPKMDQRIVAIKRYGVAELCIGLREIVIGPIGDKAQQTMSGCIIWREPIGRARSEPCARKGVTVAAHTKFAREKQGFGQAGVPWCIKRVVAYDLFEQGDCALETRCLPVHHKIPCR
ncbi:hypothetical protein CVO77_00695 [Sphingopyxis lindanitolerans]|uniref:Uncharacterized protein n=1 Tax=Sphingopyxis lindanitolerans TaxID=2054227 RepID=A0A2S8BAV4_9SPHN|nr:hypothetical protein CVO77_00695 [Sphingopyxis lindanitolerans]